MFREMGVTLEAYETRIAGLQEDAKTVIVLGDEHGIDGFIALQDTIRGNAAEVVSDLQALGIRTVMLTGDNQRAWATGRRSHGR